MFTGEPPIVSCMTCMFKIHVIRLQKCTNVRIITVQE